MTETERFTEMAMKAEHAVRAAADETVPEFFKRLGAVRPAPPPRVKTTTRMWPELHVLAAACAKRQGISLNKWISQAAELALAVDSVRPQ